MTEKNLALQNISLIILCYGKITKYGRKLQGGPLKIYQFFIKWHFVLKEKQRFFHWLYVSFVWCKFFPGTPPFCRHSSIVHNVHDPSFLVLNHCGYSHTEVCREPVQHLMGNSPGLRSSVILECISSLGIVSIDPVF